MSSEEEESVEQQQEEEQQEDEEEEDQQDEQDEDGDDEDEDEDQDQDQDDDDEDQDQDEEDEEDDSQSKEEKLPTFKQPIMSEQFKFQSLLSQISSMSTSVDNFIHSLPSHGGSHYRSNYIPKPTYEVPKPIVYPDPQPPKITIMKDEDIQVSMQPQIVIQQSIPHKQEPKKQPYKISNESTKFLAQLYEQNKKLKRWQNSQAGTTSNGFSKYRDKFERKDSEIGLINIDDRNKEIDQAIQMLRRDDYNQE